jgi:hypothetical protein
VIDVCHHDWWERWWNWNKLTWIDELISRVHASWPPSRPSAVCGANVSCRGCRRPSRKVICGGACGLPRLCARCFASSPAARERGHKEMNDDWNSGKVKRFICPCVATAELANLTLYMTAWLPNAYTYSVRIVGVGPFGIQGRRPSRPLPGLTSLILRMLF